MGSYDYGKAEVCEWVRNHIPNTEKVLDVGAGDGKWRGLLREYPMDAVEPFEPNARLLGNVYDHVFVNDVRGLEYGKYGLVIFGDVIEHMTAEEAQKVLKYAEEHATHVLIAVPWKYKQGAIYGNPYEVHIQDDLTPEIFSQRYPEFTQIWANSVYAYYVCSTITAVKEDVNCKSKKSKKTIIAPVREHYKTQKGNNNGRNQS